MNKKILLFYIATIAVLAVYANKVHRDKLQRMSNYFDYCATSEQVVEELHENSKLRAMKIEKEWNAYRLPYYGFMHAKAQSSINTNAAIHVSEHDYRFLPIESMEKYKKCAANTVENAQDSERLKKYLQKRPALRDTLKHLLSAAQQKKVGLEEYSSPEQQDLALRIASGRHFDQKSVVLKGSILNDELLVNHSLLLWNNEVEGQELENLYKFNDFMPQISLENNCIRAGEQITCEVYGLNYTKNLDENIKVSINGNPLTIENGRAKYSVQYKKAGKHQFDAVIKIQHPATKRIETIARTFQIEVCK